MNIKEATAHMPSIFGNFQIAVYKQDDLECIVLKAGHPGVENVLIRFHSECLTGDVFGSKRCDCRDQLISALTYIEEQGSGYLFYLRQEGRGIGIFNKIRAYHLQDHGLDTIQANIELGLPVDARNYDFPLQIIKELGINSVRLITNNPDKISAFTSNDIQVTERVSLNNEANEYNRKYLMIKRNKMGHFLEG